MTNNLVWHPVTIDAAWRARIKGQRPCVLWFTGLNGTGKSTIANALELALAERGKHTYLLDGDNLRLGCVATSASATQIARRISAG